MSLPAVTSSSGRPPTPINYGKMLQHAIKTTNLVDIERAIKGYKEQQIKVHELAVKIIEEKAVAQKKSPDKALAALKLETDILVQKLPNGELPLIFAVQESNTPVVEFLMKKGADPTLKDNRDFSALFCARYLNPSLSATLGSHYFSEEFSHLKELFSDPNVMQQAAKTLADIKVDIQTLNQTVKKLVVNLNKQLPKFSKTTGSKASILPAPTKEAKELEEKRLNLIQKLNKTIDAPALAATLEKLQSDQLSSDERAKIMQELEKIPELKAIEAEVEKFKSEMPKPEPVFPDERLLRIYELAKSSDLTSLQYGIEKIKESELHYLVANSDTETIKEYLAVKKNQPLVDKPNAHGFTPIYYALALGHFRTAKLLLEHGAHMDLDDVPSANLLIGTPDKEQHPSLITTLDLLYFVTSALMWSSNLLVESYTTKDQQAESATLDLLGKACLGMHVITSVYTTSRLYGQMPAPLYLFFMAYKSLLFDFNHPINSFIKIYEIAGFSYKAFSAIYNSLRNTAYGRGRALLKAAIVGLPNLHIAWHRFQHFALDPWIEIATASAPKPVAPPPSNKPMRLRPTSARTRIPRGNPTPAPVPDAAKPRLFFPSLLPPALGFNRYFTKI